VRTCEPYMAQPVGHDVVQLQLAGVLKNDIHAEYVPKPTRSTHVESSESRRNFLYVVWPFLAALSVRFEPNAQASRGQCNNPKINVAAAVLPHLSNQYGRGNGWHAPSFTCIESNFISFFFLARRFSIESGEIVRGFVRVRCLVCFTLLSLSRLRRSPMVNMKALSVLFNFSHRKIWIHILRYENAAFTRKNLTMLWSSVAVSE
jgi:hypothetical protein